MCTTLTTIFEHLCQSFDGMILEINMEIYLLNMGQYRCTVVYSIDIRNTVLRLHRHFTNGTDTIFEERLHTTLNTTQHKATQK